jgi:hypothetical protein
MQLRRVSGVRPTSKDQQSSVEKFVRTMLSKQSAPVAGSPHGLVFMIKIGGLLGPVDRKIDLADLLERPGGPLEPRRDPAVLGMARMIASTS